MTMYYSLRFRGRLIDPLILTVEDFLDFVRAKDLCLHLDTGPSEYYGVEPSFGRHGILRRAFWCVERLPRYRWGIGIRLLGREPDLGAI